MPLLRVHFSIVQILPRLDRASFKNPSCNFAEWGAKVHGIKTRHRVSRKHLLLPLFLPARGRLTRISASPGGVEHLDIPVWSLHNARCALEFCAEPPLRVSSPPLLFLHLVFVLRCGETRRRSRRRRSSPASYPDRDISGPFPWPGAGCRDDFWQDATRRPVRAYMPITPVNWQFSHVN